MDVPESLERPPPRITSRMMPRTQRILHPFALRSRLLAPPAPRPVAEDSEWVLIDAIDLCDDYTDSIRTRAQPTSS